MKATSETKIWLHFIQYLPYKIKDKFIYLTYFTSIYNGKNLWKNIWEKFSHSIVQIPKI